MWAEDFSGWVQTHRRQCQRGYITREWWTITIIPGPVGATAGGDVMKLQIKVDDNTGKITDTCFKTFGCGSAIPSSSVATEWVKGKQMEEVLSIKNTKLQTWRSILLGKVNKEREIAKHLSLPPVKLHCSMLAEDAI